MANIPLAQQASVFQPQTGAAPTQGFQALQTLFGGIGQEAAKLNEQQIAADKLVGSNQIQTSLRNLQESATLKFPGDYVKQQQFMNSGAQAFLGSFISGSNFANRSYFTAVSKNLMSTANFSYAKNIASQNLRNQRLAFTGTYEDSVAKSNELLRNGSTALAKDKMGKTFASIQSAVKFNLVSPQAGQIMIQKMLVSHNVAGAKNKIDLAVPGGISAVLKMQEEILSDKNNEVLNNPLTSVTFTAQVKSYVNGINAGLKATQSANKSQIKAIEDNALKTGKFDPLKVASFDIGEKVALNVAAFSKTMEFFTQGAVQREKSLAGLDLGTPFGIAVSKNEASFEAVYKKDRMNFLMQQTSINHGEALNNATPEQLQNMRTAGVALERQRGDLQIKPMTNAEVNPVILAAKSGDPVSFRSALNDYTQKAGQFKKSALIQLTQKLVKNGVNPIIEDLPHLGPNNADVEQNIVNASVMNRATNRLALETQLAVTPKKLTSDINSAIQGTISPSGLFTRTPFVGGENKLIQSIKNSAGSKQGEAIGELRKNLETYILYTVPNGEEPNIQTASDNYMNAYLNSFNYIPTANSLQIRVPKEFHGRPVDQIKVAAALKAKQASLGFRNFDLSDVSVLPILGKITSQARFYNTVVVGNHWANLPDGNSWVLEDKQNKVLKSKDGQNITMNLTNIIGN